MGKMSDAQAQQTLRAFAQGLRYAIQLDDAITTALNADARREKATADMAQAEEQLRAMKDAVATATHSLEDVKRKLQDSDDALREQQAMTLRERDNTRRAVLDTQAACDEVKTAAKRELADLTAQVEAERKALAEAKAQLAAFHQQVAGMASA